jgi:hypothetical protein
MNIDRISKTEGLTELSDAELDGVNGGRFMDEVEYVRNRVFDAADWVQDKVHNAAQAVADATKR